MRIERISDKQFAIFLTFDDLVERGFTEDELWHDAQNVQDLFSDMMYEAYEELGLELAGMLLVQVRLMQAQGMHIVVTQEDETFDVDDEYVEMKVTLDESNEVIFSFDDFEHIISVCSYLQSMQLEQSDIYFLDGKYYMLIDESALVYRNKEDIIAIMSEFGSPSIVTSYRLKEYGDMIVEREAVQKINKYFSH
ncbi:MAG TPA: genetic competence negative regulator [Bacillota bacterium]|nr:genetic competence negative regulator [Bacillota bacterium]